MQTIKQLIPLSIKENIKDIRDTLQRRRLFGRNAVLVPPKKLMFDGPVDYYIFKQNGEEYLKFYIELCDLKPDEKVLDVGSGVGRKTLPLTSYLNRSGSYEGLDIVKAGVEWCQQHITPRFPQFRFQQIDVLNKLYNPTGSGQAATYRFPFDDRYFDFVVLGSVFTHMMPEEMENYLSEIARVLKQGGRCLITFFLLNDESLPLIEAGKSKLDLRHIATHCRFLDSAAPEKAVGYDENYVHEVYKTCGLEIQQPIRYGSWCGRNEFLTYQDIIIAHKV